MSATEQQIADLAAVVARQAQSIVDGIGSRHAAAILLADNADTLRAWIETAEARR